MNVKHVLLPWLEMLAGEIITRYKMVHDGKSAYQRTKSKRSSNYMQPVGEKSCQDDAQMQPKMKHIGVGRNSFGVCQEHENSRLLCCCSTYNPHVVLRTEVGHLCSEIVSKVTGASWDFTANAGEYVRDGSISEPNELPPRIGVRRMHTHKVLVEKYGPTRRCPVCQRSRRKVDLLASWPHTVGVP